MFVILPSAWGFQRGGNTEWYRALGGGVGFVVLGWVLAPEPVSRKEGGKEGRKEGRGGLLNYMALRQGGYDGWDGMGMFVGAFWGEEFTSQVDLLEYRVTPFFLFSFLISFPAEWMDGWMGIIRTAKKQTRWPFYREPFFKGGGNRRSPRI